jgi:hypothetical protein
MYSLSLIGYRAFILRLRSMSITKGSMDIYFLMCPDVRVVMLNSHLGGDMKVVKIYLDIVYQFNEVVPSRTKDRLIEMFRLKPASGVLNEES